MSKFTTPSSGKKYGGAVDYNDREEAKEKALQNAKNNISELEKELLEVSGRENYIGIENQLFTSEEFGQMIDYTDRRSMKQTDDVMTFTSLSDKIDNKEKQRIKGFFNKAQKNGSPMYQDVISFDTEFLEKYGVYDRNNDILDDKKLKDITRKAIDSAFKQEKMHNAFWYGNIHYNTDHFHIHVNSVEMHSTRKLHENGEYKGSRKFKHIEKIKSTFVNAITKDKNLENEVETILKKNIVKATKDGEKRKSKSMAKLFKEIYTSLPEDKNKKNYWTYGNLSKDPEMKEKIDKLSEYYINTHHKKDYKELLKGLDKAEKRFKDGYGIKDERFKEYKQNRLYSEDSKNAGLFYRMGNVVVDELRNYHKVQKENIYRKFNKDKNIDKSKLQIKSNSSLKGNLNRTYYSMKKLEKYMNNKYQNFKNQQKYQELERNVEMNKNSNSM